MSGWRLFDRLPCCFDSCDSIFAYNTAKVVRLKDRRLGLIWISTMLIILIYVGVYVLWYSEGYLKNQFTTGSVATKSKGRALGSYQDLGTGAQLNYYVDAADLLYPPMQGSSLFIITKIQRTPTQRQPGIGTVPDYGCVIPTTKKTLDAHHVHPDSGEWIYTWDCVTDTDCKTNKVGSDEPEFDEPGSCRGSTEWPPNAHGNDPYWGANVGNLTRRRFCFYKQWCPAESDVAKDDDKHYPVNSQIINFEHNATKPGSVGSITIWIKASIWFDALQGGDVNKTFFSTITSANPIPYNPSDPSSREKANLFSLHDLINFAMDQGGIVNEITRQKQETSMFEEGAILKLRQYWEVDTDNGYNKVQYKVQRLDDLDIKGDKGGNGLNYRTGTTIPDTPSDPNSNRTRTLHKYWGILILLESSGRGWEVSIQAIVLQLASAVALLGVATIVTDTLALYVLPEKKVYEDWKVQQSEILYDVSESEDDVEDEEIGKQQTVTTAADKISTERSRLIPPTPPSSVLVAHMTGYKHKTKPAQSKTPPPRPPTKLNGTPNTSTEEVSNA